MKREKPLPKLYRGENRFVWEKRFVDAGWPQPMATQTATFLVGMGPLPRWPSEHFGDPDRPGVGNEDDH